MDLRGFQVVNSLSIQKQYTQETCDILMVNYAYGSIGKQ